MARPMVTMAVFLLAFSLFGQMLMSTGVAATIGIDTNVGAEETTSEVTAAANESTETGSSTGDTLFGLYNVLSVQIGDILNILNPGMTMLENAGVPDPIVNSLLQPLATVIKAIGIISFLRGWDL